MDNLVICVGTQNLIKSAIQVVCHEFPWVEKLRFQDSSSKKCGNKSEIISLSDLIIATQGKTWYEKHYNDYLEDAKLNSYYHSYLFNMTKSPHAKLNWDLFSTLVYSFQSNNLHKIIYKNSNTYLEFFNNLLLSFKNKDDFCYFISGWITQFTNNIILNN